MVDPIDKAHFQDLRELKPDEVCKRAGCVYDEKEGTYSLNVWGKDFKVHPEEDRVVCVAPDGSDLHEYFHLFLMHYLLSIRDDISLANEWISEKDIPGGSTFFRGPHEIPTHLITKKYNNAVDAFKSACENMNGAPENMGDAAYVFEIMPRVPVLVIYWVGDEDFAAEAKILYDKSIGAHFRGDMVYALGVGICHELGRR